MFFAAEDGKNSESSSSLRCRHFELSEIQWATDNFDESLVIGRGGFGKVYKGAIVNGSGRIDAAIKRLDSMSDQGAPEFWAEVDMLSRLRHCHLVSLIGHCNDGKEMILVYEYMPHGTLEDHLHRYGSSLSWLQRLKICIGAARGLDYLHTGTGIELGVIHRDVKSSNILLHESWEAKISDFGLSKIGPKNQPSTYVNTLVKGTFGYLDPDYFRTGRLTRKSDVYAFGVVLLEVLCRKRAVDRSLDEEQWGLVGWAQDSIKEGKLKNIIDSDVRNQISPKCLKEFAQIADRCLHDHPKERPTMAEVVSNLEYILSLQEKYNNSLQAAGRTVFGRLVDMFPFPVKRKQSVPSDSNLTGGKNNNFLNIKEVPADRTIPSPRLQVFKFVDLRTATRDFSSAMLLHDDSLGYVYLGWVDSKTFAPSSPGVGRPVSARRCSPAYHLRDAEWVADVSLFGRLDHPNISRLLGYCNDKYERFLVYEYIHERGLDVFLFTNNEPLSWETRLNIMLGVARGLVYLHSPQVQVIHRALKSSTILLDQDFNAKLGDFGGSENNHEDSASTRLVGSFLTLDPQYFMTGRFTTSTDIYNFGVVVLETLTGKRVIDRKRPEGYWNLAIWIRSLAENGELKNEELEKIMDPRLELKYPIEAAFECIKLALRCVADKSKDRPSSEEVLWSLEGISSLTR